MISSAISETETITSIYFLNICENCLNIFSIPLTEIYIKLNTNGSARNVILNPEVINHHAWYRHNFTTYQYCMLARPAFNCTKSTMKILEQYVKSI